MRIYIVICSMMLSVARFDFSLQSQHDDEAFEDVVPGSFNSMMERATEYVRCRMTVSIVKSF